MSSNTYLNISKTLSYSRANGPGTRAVIWVQGCTIGCDGCYSQSTHPHRKIHLVDPLELAKWVCSIDGIEGVFLCDEIRSYFSGNIGLGRIQVQFHPVVFQVVVLGEFIDPKIQQLLAVLLFQLDDAAQVFANEWFFRLTEGNH